MSFLEPVVESGNFHMTKAWWNDDALEECGEFPNGAHDDKPDAIAGGFAADVKEFGFGESPFTQAS